MKRPRNKGIQPFLFKEKRRSSYGGELLKTRAGRAHGRPLATRTSIHLVLRSSKAKGDWSFSRPENKAKIRKIFDRFCQKYGVKVLTHAYVGNHMHFQIKLSKRQTYRAFIRAITSAIVMAVTGASRWQPFSTFCEGKFWDYRPFTRIVQGFRDHLGLKEYIRLNQLEGCGYTRTQARYVLAKEWRNMAASP